MVYGVSPQRKNGIQSAGYNLSMVHREKLRPERPLARLRISWGMILAGAACIWVSKLFLSHIAGIAGDGPPVGPEAWGRDLWLVALTSTGFVWLIAWFIARLGRIHSARIGAMHGFMAWCLAFALGLFLAFSGRDQLAGAPEALLNAESPSTGMGGTLEDGERGASLGGVGDRAVHWGFALLGLQIGAAIWGGWAGTASLRRTNQRQKA